MHKYIITLSFILCFFTLKISAKEPYPKMDKELITFMKDAGWCWFEDPRAIIHNNKLIIGGISGVTGDVKISVYDLKANKLLGTTTLHEKFERDDHNSPVFYVRPDGSLLCFWAMHGKENVHYYSISSPTNYLEWGERQEYVHNFTIAKNNTWGGVTYMNLYSIENNGTLYNFFRNNPSYNPTFIHSTDNGNTWSKNSTHFIMDEVAGRQRPYIRYMQKDKNRIAFSFTDGHPRGYGNSLYYAEFDGKSYYRADGSKIKDISQGPLKTIETEKVYVGSETKTKPEGFESVPNSAWSSDIEKDKKSRPYMGYTLYLNGNDHRFRLANWTGKEWNDREIAFAGNCLYARESSYTGLIALDPEKPNNVAISTDVNPNTGVDSKGKHEIYIAQLKKGDTTSSIEWEQLTSNSEHRNIRPIIVTGDGYKVLLWLSGPWTDFHNYKSNIVGHILERP